MSPFRFPETEAWRRYKRLLEERPELRAAGGPDALALLTEEGEVAAAVAARCEQLRGMGYPETMAAVGLLLDTPYFTVLQDAVRFPGGTLGTYYRQVLPLEVTPGSVILPVHEGEVVVLEHFRHATRSWHWEIPRGFRQPGTTPEETAHAELEEEIEGRARSLTSLGRLHTNTGLSSEFAELFHAELDGFAETERSAGIRAARRLPVADLEAMIRDGTITDGFTLAAFTRARLRGLI